MLPLFPFFIATVICTVGSIISFAAYRHESNRVKSPKKPNEKNADETIRPLLEENKQLKEKLEKAEELFRDIKAAKKLEPD